MKRIAGSGLLLHVSQALTSWKFLLVPVSRRFIDFSWEIGKPRIEKGQVSRYGFHGLEGMTLEHLRVVTVSWKFFPPRNVVVWGLPLSVVDQGVASRGLVEKDVPGDLGNNLANLPACGFLQRS